MALRRQDNVQTTRLQAASALAMAMFEQKGLRGLIDSKFPKDPRMKLTPGMPPRFRMAGRGGQRGFGVGCCGHACR